MPRGRIRVKLKSYDHRVLDNTCESLLDTALRTGAKIAGPIPLPTKTERMTVLTSPHTDKDSREAFEIKTHKRMIDIIEPTQKTIDSLMHLEVPAGVDIEVKMWYKVFVHLPTDKMAIDIERLAQDKLTGGSGLTVSKGGRFLFPSSLVEQYHRKTEVESRFKGAYLRSDSEVQILSSVPEELRFPLWPFKGRILGTLPARTAIMVYITPVNQVTQLAHRLELEKGKDPKLTSIIAMRLIVANVSSKVPTQEDYDFFASIIRESDSRNILSPTAYYLTKPQPSR